MKSRDLGPVKFQLQREGKKIGLDVEAKYDPTVFVDEAGALAARISRALDCSELVVRVVRPGTLKKPWAKF